MKFAAHVIMSVKFAKGIQDRFPVYENVVLVDADTDAEALEKATAIGMEDVETDSESFRWNDRPATLIFAGIRKLIECRSLGGSDDRVGDGTEISYSQMTLRSEDDLRKLVEGDPVQVTYEE